MKVAVFGCLHGQLNDMYAAIDTYEKENNVKIELVIVCGDCQTIRHEHDLKCLAVPRKYWKGIPKDFQEYYSGARIVPRLTIFVGGNHEASNYLMTLPYGGWICDKFYYLGFAGVIRYKGLRIAGVSGIYNSYNCNRGRFERLPLDNDTVRSIYHIRRLDIFRLSLLSRNIAKPNQLDIFMSHDWPARVYEHGDLQQLLRYKPFFRKDVEEKRDGLGNPMTRPLIGKLKPRRWFAAHLHCKFTAVVKHDQTGDEVTEFLSLNKIEQRRHFVEYLDIVPLDGQESSKEGDSGGFSEESDSQHDDDLYYDEEWLTILKKTVDLEYRSTNNVPCPNVDDERAQPYFPTDDEVKDTRDMMTKSGGLQIKKNFRMSEPVIYNREDGKPASIDENRVTYFPNPQHIDLCSRLGISDKIADGSVAEPGTSSHQNRATSHAKIDNDLISDKSRNNLYVHPNATSRAVARQGSREGHSSKKQAVELDDEGCLPFFIDKKGDS